MHLTVKLLQFCCEKREMAFLNNLILTMEYTSLMIKTIDLNCLKKIICDIANITCKTVYIVCYSANTVCYTVDSVCKTDIRCY